jgi:hypothetical protein
LTSFVSGIFSFWVMPRAFPDWCLL